MSKHEFPPFVMVIENGRLVPANPHDAERLNSYRRGTKVFVRFTEEKDRVLVRKWFAILGLVLKTCDTPWQNKEQAHEAIKLALGIVNLSKTVGGKFMQYPRSLAELTDPELQEALEQMTELLSRMTGVDVETLKKETAHIVPEEITDTGEDTPRPAGNDAAPATAASEGDDQTANTSSPSSNPWLLNIARMLVAATNHNGDVSVLKAQRHAAIASYPKPDDCPPVISGKAESVYAYCKQIVEGAIDPDDGLAIIAGVVGCDQDDLKTKGD